MYFEVYFSGVYVREHNRPFPSHLVALFQNESSCKNEYHFHEHEPVDGTNIHMNGLALRITSDQIKYQNTVKVMICFL